VWGGLQHYGNFSSIWAIVGYNNDMSLYTFQDKRNGKIQGTHAWKFWCFWLAPTTKTRISSAAATVPRLASTTKVGANIGIVTGNTLANVLLPGTGAKSTDDCRAWAKRTLTRWITANGTTSSSMPAIPGSFNRRVTLTYGLRWSFLREPYDDKQPDGVLQPGSL